MKWNTIDFGKYRYDGCLIAHIAFKDPEYFNWCLSAGVFKGSSLSQAHIANHNLRNLRLPANLRDTHCVQMLYDWVGKLTDVRVVEVALLPATPAHNEVRSDTLNMVFKTDGVGRKLIRKALKDHWLGGKALTKARLETLLAEPVAPTSLH